MKNYHFIIMILLLGISSLASITTPTQATESVGLVKVNQAEETIIYALPYDFSEYSVYHAYSYPTAQWTSAVSVGLLKRSVDNGRDWAPELVVDLPQRSNFDMTYTFELRENMYFSNGEPLTSEDVGFSLFVAINYDINQAGFYKYYEYLNEYSFSYISDTSFSLTLSYPSPWAHTYFDFPIVPQETYQDLYDSCLFGIYEDCYWNDPSGFHSVGAGPFMLSEIDDINQLVTLVANPYYYDATSVRTDKIIFQKIADKYATISALADGSIDILDSAYVPGVDELSFIPGVQDMFAGESSYQEIAINNLHPYFGTGMSIPGVLDEQDAWNKALLVRRAMSHIVDRETYANVIMDGLADPASSPIGSGIIGYDPNVTVDPYDVGYARVLMEIAGFDYGTIGGDIPEDQAYEDYFFWITTLSPNTNPERNQWSADYVQQLQKIGIGVLQHVATGWAEIVPRTFGSYSIPGTYDEGGYDIFFIGYSWGLDWFPSSLYDFSGNCASGNCLNYFNFDLDETKTPIADVVRAYSSEFDPNVRNSMVSELQYLLHEYLPVIPILFPLVHMATESTVHGVDTLLLYYSELDWSHVFKDGFTSNPGPSNIIGPDAFESDNDKASATLLERGTTDNHSIHRFGDRDFFVFTLSHDSKVKLQTNSPDPEADTVMYLHNSKKVAASDDDSGENWLSYLELKLEAGTYYVEIGAFDDVEKIESYTLTFWTNRGKGNDQTRSELDFAPLALTPVLVGLLIPISIKIKNRKFH